jgi:5-methylthioadenosine/S-adenosylhomocysteine deaminase
VISAQQAFEFATIRGAQALHLENEIGSLEVGKRADVLVINRDTLNQIPVYNIYSDLVYATKAADVETVVINGRVVMRERHLLTLDETAVKNAARAFHDRIIKSVGSTGAP